MKITLTEKGLEFRRESISQSNATSLLQRPFTDQQASLNTTSLKFIFRRQSLPDKPKTARNSPTSRELFPALLDTFLPAMISINPPKSILIKRPRVNHSREFSEKQTSSIASYSSPRYQEQSDILQRKEQQITLMSSIQKHMNESRAFSLSRKKEKATAEIISKSLKYQKILQKQDQINKLRHEMGSRRVDLMKRNETLDAEILEKKSRQQDEWNENKYNVVLPKRNDRERYLNRLNICFMKKTSGWENQKRILQLATPRKYVKKYVFGESTGSIN